MESKIVISNLKILIDILDKKTIILENILNITENQKVLLEAEKFAEKIFKEMNVNKKAKIDKINSIDERFTSIYDDIKKYLVYNKNEYSSYIKKIQDKISNNMNFKMKIEICEQANKKIIEDINNCG